MDQFKVAYFFLNEHHDLADAFNKFQNLKRFNYPLAKESFKNFKFGLQRHIVLNEDYVFPLYERITSTDGETQRIRKEHRDLELAMEALHKKVQRKDPESDAQDNAVLNVFNTHYASEKCVYDFIDNNATSAQIEELRNLMAKLPPERYQVCCNHHVHF